MYKHQELFLDTTKEYTRQINLLLDMAKTADRKQIQRLHPILEKLKSSLQNLTRATPGFKRYINNPVKYKTLLQPYIDLLEETKSEIERLQYEPKH